jgi:hypothetical protein
VDAYLNKISLELHSKIDLRMKNFEKLFALLCLLVIICIACTKDLSGPVDTNFLSNKWNFDKSTVSTNGITLPFPTEYLKNETGCPNDYIEMVASGTFKFGNYSANCALDERSGSWSTNEKKIVISLPGTDLNNTFVIAKLNSNELILQIDQAYQGKTGTVNLFFKK